MALIPKSFGTHDGTFHADEVSACALLCHFGLIDPEKIVRTRDMQKLESCEYVCDVGGIYNPGKKRFDHHQVEYEGDFSSAGMILKYLKDTKIIDQGVYDHLNRSLILGVDAHDNGRTPPDLGFCSFSNIVSNFMPIVYEAPLEEVEAAFREALQFVRGHISRLLERFFYIQSCRQEIEKAMKKREEVLIFEKSMPWIDMFFELGGEKHPARFVIMPSGKSWKLRGIPPTSYERMKVRQPLPLEWAGLIGEQLQKISGVPGAIFCHKGRFISVWQTKEEALKALEYALKKR